MAILWGEHLAQRGPEPQRAVADREYRGACGGACTSGAGRRRTRWTRGVRRRARSAPWSRRRGLRPSQQTHLVLLAAVGRRYAAVRGRFTRMLQAGSRRQGDLATLGWAPARQLRDHLLPLLAGAGWLQRRSALVTAGYNPAEPEPLPPGP